jgi:predicted secreted protein
MAKYALKGSTLTVNSVLIPQWVPSGSSGGEAEKIDVTTMDSTGGYREFLSGFKGESSYSFYIEYDPALPAHLGLAALYASGNVVPVVIGLPTSPATSIAFSASVGQFSIPTGDAGSSLRVDVTLTIAGAITFPVSGS